MSGGVIEWPGDYPPDKLRVRDGTSGDFLWEVESFEPGRFRLPLEQGVAYSLSFQGVWSHGLLGLAIDRLVRR